MNLKSNVIGISVGVLFLFAGTLYLVSNRTVFVPLVSDRPHKEVQGFLFEIANTPQAKQQGLSGRATLNENQGMLFPFSEPSTPGIWMKDMRFAIDIIWLSDTGLVLGVEENVMPETYLENPPRVFYPPQPVSYVLEVRAGVARERGFLVGSVIPLPHLQ